MLTLKTTSEKAIIHLTSPQVQFQNLVLSQGELTEKNIALALFTVCSFRRQLQSGPGGARKRRSKSRGEWIGREQDAGRVGTY